MGSELAAGRSGRSQQPKMWLQRKLYKAFALDAVDDVLHAYLVRQGSYRTRLGGLESELLLSCRSFELTEGKYQATLVAVSKKSLVDHLDDIGCRLGRILVDRGEYPRSADPHQEHGVGLEHPLQEMSQVSRVYSNVEETELMIEESDYQDMKTIGAKDAPEVDFLDLSSWQQSCRH